MKCPRFASLSIALIFLVGFPAAIGSSLDANLSAAGQCGGKESVPIEVVLSLPNPALTDGASAVVHATITAQADMNDIDVRVEREGNVNLLGAAGRYIGSLAQGEKVELDIPVQFGEVDRSAVFVSVSARHPSTGESMGRREGIYTIYRNGRSYLGNEGFETLARSAIRQEYGSGLITEEQYQVQMKEALRPDGTFDQTPREAPPASAAMAAIPKLEPSVSAGQPPLQQAPVNPAGTVTVQGTVLFTDVNGNTHGAYGVQVEVWDDDTIIDEFITSATVGGDGQYYFVVDNDDGFLQNGRDIYVKFLTKNEAIDVKDGDTYGAESSVHDELADGAIVTENFTFSNSGDGAAGSVCVGLSYLAAYVKFELNGGSALSQIDVHWPFGGAYYDADGVHIRQGDRFDWDVMDHEYGHYVMDTFNFEDNPGGAHSSADCAANVRGNKSEGIRLAWGESWPTFFALSSQQEYGLDGLGIPRVGDDHYQDTEESSLDYSLETNLEPLHGEDNERSLMRVFWDLWDTAVDNNDNVSFDDKALFDIWDASDAHTLSQGWAALRASSLVPDNETDLAIGAMCSDYGIGPVPTSPLGGATVSPSSASLSWTGAVGCGSVAAGDDWDLVFYNPTTYAKILTIPSLATTNTSLSLANLQTLIAGSANHEVLWGAEGRGTASPATGPYLGDAFSVLVNQPPVADAGTDVLRECDSHTGTEVALDGAGSSDPDGDALTYYWEADGITFDDPNSATPTGIFPLGETIVTLTVSDGLDTDEDEVKVTIVDTTPPYVVCAPAITVECSAFCGVPADDPQLTDFFAAFSASDVCCDVDTTLTHPTCFPLGPTVVTYQAEDCSGNKATCSTIVTVVDTTPPEIDVVLNRDVLWPPNHKMADITADVTVSDICCAAPTFALVSITSDEPENGKGDGNTSPDVLNADYGTPDVAFQLRSERSGNGDGRVYTVNYLATDCSGNTTPASVEVRVPHDHSGWAFASMGFQQGELGFDPALDRFVLIIPSRPAEYTVDGKGNRILVAEAFDATALDVSRTYVGNLKDVALPNESLQVDNNADGLKDLALYYPAPAVNAILAASTVVLENGLDRDESWGAIGLHYRSASGVDYLVPNIFRLGEPVPLVPPIVIRRTDEPVIPEPPKEETPKVTALLNIHPNPFNPTTTIPFQLVSQERVSLRIYDAQGKLVRTLLDQQMPAGAHSAVWDGMDNSGSQAATGVYFVQFTAGAKQMTKKVVMIK
jgi:hypothetical protein